MEPKIKYIVFFEEMEIIIKKQRDFPSFRSPFVELEVTELPSNKNIAVLIAVENINASSEPKFEIKVVLKSPSNEDILTIKQSFDTKGKGLMLGFEREVIFEENGDHKLQVFYEDKLIGEENFIVKLQKVKRDADEQEGRT